MPIRTPKPPKDWHYGVMLRPVGASRQPDRVMFVKMAEDNGSSMAQFEGLTIQTDSRGERIGKLRRIDRFNVHRYKIDGT